MALICPEMLFLRLKESRAKIHARCKGDALGSTAHLSIKLWYCMGTGTLEVSTSDEIVHSVEIDGTSWMAGAQLQGSAALFRHWLLVKWILFVGIQHLQL